MKTRNSVKKRIKVTKTGKLLRRKMAQDHFRAGKSGRQIHRKRVSKAVHKSDQRNILKHLR